MLKIIVGLVILLVIALIGYRRTFTRLRLPIGARFVFLTGTEFVFVGFALGSEMIGVLDEPTIRSLTPLFGLGLGLVGLILGIQVEVRMLGRFPGAYLRTTIVQAVVTMVVVFWPSWVLLRRLFGRHDEAVLLASLVLAATAACTAQSALVLVSRELRMRSTKILDLLRYVSGLDGLVAIVLFGFAYCLMHEHSAVGVNAGVGLQWFGLSVAMGLAMGFLLHLLTRVRCAEEELLVFVLGLVLFSAGLAAYLRLSPLFVCMTMGLLATNMPGSKTRILNLTARMEKPFYVIFLVLAGAIWSPGSPWAIAVAAVYVLARVSGKLLGGFLAVRSSPGTSPDSLGLGLLSQGGVAIAMIMSFYHASAGPVTGVAVTAVLLAVIVSELFGPSLARDLLVRTGEAEE